MKEVMLDRDQINFTEWMRGLFSLEAQVVPNFVSCTHNTEMYL